MKIEYITGCVYNSLTIDDEETVDVSMGDLKEVIKKVIDKIDDLALLQSVLISIIEGSGEYEDLGQCEECGDSIDKYILNIE